MFISRSCCVHWWLFFNEYHKGLHNIVTAMVFKHCIAAGVPSACRQQHCPCIASILVRLSWSEAAVAGGRGSNIRGPERVQSSGHVVAKMCRRK
jgi:hypothetical protein